MARNTWTPLRVAVEQVQQTAFSQGYIFEPLPIQQWESIEQRVLNTFFKPSIRPINFERLHNCNSKIHLADWNLLDKELTNFFGNEPIYFAIDETVNEQTKWWWYQSQSNIVSVVLNDLNGINEVVICNKSFTKLAYLNHHDFLIFCER